MSVRTRNEFLEHDDSEDEIDNGYQSDEAEEGRGAIGGRTNKRRKTEHHSDNESLADEDAEDDDLKDGLAETEDHVQPSHHISGLAQNDLLPPANPSAIPKSVAAAEKAVRKSGVVYLSRIPPFMKPQTLRHFLAPHASKGLGRIFLTPEDHTAHLARVKNGGNKKKSYTDGWVEFTSKTEAQTAAATLNGNIMGGKKGGFYYDDLWNMKYLKGFKWSHLTEQIANENAERAARLREEVRRTRKENKAFLEDVERGKMLEGMERKRKGKRKVEDEGGDGVGEGRQARGGREFKQRKVQVKDGVQGDGKQAAELKRVLGKIF